MKKKTEEEQLEEQAEILEKRLEELKTRKKPIQ